MFDELTNRLNFCKKKHTENGIPKSLEDIQNLKCYIPYHQKCCVYFLCKDNEVVYIGQTTNLHFRLDYHVKHKDFDSVYFIEVNKKDLVKVESYYAKKLTPEGEPLLSISKKTARDLAYDYWLRESIRRIKKEELQAIERLNKPKVFRI